MPAPKHLEDAIKKKSQPSALAEGLRARWAAPTEQQNLALGEALWADALMTSLDALFPEAAIAPLARLLVVESVARETLKHVPRAWVEADQQRLRGAGYVLNDLVGKEGAERLRRLVVKPQTVNRRLISELIDQPIVRQAVRETLQSGLQQFVSELGESLPFSRSSVGPTGGMARGVLGELGRGFAKRAKESARIGMTWAEGLGLNRAFEDQIQPFVSAWAQRAMGSLLDGLFSGEQAELAAEARLNALEILLETPVEELLPEPDLSLIDLRLRAAEAILGHAATLEGQPDAMAALVIGWRKGFAKGTVSELCERLGLPKHPGDDLLTILGAMGHAALSRPSLSAWLAEEVDAAQGAAPQASASK